MNRNKDYIASYPDHCIQFKCPYCGKKKAEVTGGGTLLLTGARDVSFQCRKDSKHKWSLDFRNGKVIGMILGSHKQTVVPCIDYKEYAQKKIDKAIERAES